MAPHVGLIEESRERDDDGSGHGGTEHHPGGKLPGKREQARASDVESPDDAPECNQKTIDEGDFGKPGEERQRQAERQGN